MRSVALSVMIALAALANGGDMTEKIAKDYVVKIADDWHGGRRTVFDFEGYDAWVVEPPSGVAIADGKPWTWTMQWRDAFVPRTGVPQLLRHGWHHVSIDTFKDRMDENGLAVSKRFRDYLVGRLGLFAKAHLIGMSWGGFFSVRYAATNPNDVAKIYLDCPFLDLGGAWASVDIGPWKDSAPADWSKDPQMPVNLANVLATARIPVLLAYGGADNVLAPSRNAETFIPRFKEAGGLIKVIHRPLYGHHPHGFEIGDTTVVDFFIGHKRPSPRPALLKRIREGVELYGIVHWGLNTYSDREWGYGDEDPKTLAPTNFNADQIVEACRKGGLQGLIVVAKHHDGFCLWPTKTTEHNITKSPFRGGKGDYVKEMEQACRRHGLRFGIYVSPWDRNNAAYGTDKYVTEVFHRQIRELLGGGYGEIFEMWFDGANGGDGYYGGARERRKIPGGYYKYDDFYAVVRAMQPNVCIFNGDDGADYRWPGNERGVLDPDSRATVRGLDKSNYRSYCNAGDAEGTTFHPCEADFPLRPGWFYHDREKGKTKCAAYLMQRYLSTVGNGGTMNLGISPNREGRLDEEDVKALSGFGELQGIFFSRPSKDLCNVVVMKEDVSNGENVDEWTLLSGDDVVASGRSIGTKRIRILEKPMPRDTLRVIARKGNGAFVDDTVSLEGYLVDPDLLQVVKSATTESGETDTAKWMTAGKGN